MRRDFLAVSVSVRYRDSRESGDKEQNCLFISCFEFQLAIGFRGEAFFKQYYLAVLSCMTLTLLLMKLVVSLPVIDLKFKVLDVDKCNQ